MKIKGPVYFLGDTHNSRVTEKVLAYSQITDATVIHVGDGGIDDGFGEIVAPFTDQMLSARNLKLIMIRGNHDSPAEYPNRFSKFLHLVDDYTTVELEDYSNFKALLVGGGISLDRNLSTEGVNYWSGEPTKPVPKDLGPHDIVIAHDCPSWINKTTDSIPEALLNFWRADDQLIEDCNKQRSVMDEIFERVKPCQWWYGHFHNDLYNFERNCHFQCLNINRLHNFC